MKCTRCVTCTATTRIRWTTKYAAEGEVTFEPLCDECVEVVKKIHASNAAKSAAKGAPLEPLRFESLD